MSKIIIGTILSLLIILKNPILLLSLKNIDNTFLYLT